MEYWSIILENYKGYDDVYYFDNYSVAEKTFKNLCEKYKNYDEFERTDDECSWFDPGYNEYSTFAKLEKSTIYIFDKVVDL